MIKSFLYFMMSFVGVAACGWAYLRHPEPTKAFGRAMVLIAAVTWYAAFGSSLQGMAMSPTGDTGAAGVQVVDEGPEPDPGQAWPPDPSLTQAPWVRPQGLAFHVTAGGRLAAFGHYHINAVADARRIVRTLPDTTPGAHVYRANSGTVGLALACGAGSIYSAAPAFDLRGGVQPTPQQVEDLAAVAAEVCAKWGLDPEGKRRLNIGAVVPVLGTHRDYALAGGYGADRFDPGGALAKALRSKAIWYHRALKRGARKAAWVR